MQNRFALRFENGERSGESIPIPEGGLSLGRRPGNSVQILDASVSGKHAELSLDGQGALLRDLGSTNGTRVAGKRISEQRLEPGDDVLIGNVRFTFLDQAQQAAGGSLALSDTGEIDLEEPDPPAAEPSVAAVPAQRVRPAPSAPPATPAAARTAPDEPPVDLGEAVQTIAADKVARTRARPLAAGLLLGVLIVGGAGVAWYLLRGDAQAGKRTAVVPVVPVAGDLLAAGYSFEEGRGGWEGDPRSPAGFAVETLARTSGEVGLQAELEVAEDGQPEWALEQSPLVRLTAGRSLSARARLAASGGAEIVIGVRLESSRAAAQPTVLWSTPIGAGAGDTAEFLVDVPGVYDSARALLLARLRPAESAGSASADDVSLVPVPPAGGRSKLGETELFLSGSGAVLFKIDHALISDISVHAPGQSADPGAPRARLAVETQPNGLRLSAPSQGGAHALSLFVESGLAAGGLASTGEGGYRTHQVEFERAGARALFLGSGRDMVRLDCSAARRISGRPEGGGFRVELEFAAAPEVFVQVSFREERDAAQVLARQARRAEEEGRLGEALTGWSRLLDEYPYEEALVAEAGSTRGRLEQSGHAELRVLGQRLERARFFRLLDIFRRCHEDALALTGRYEPSDVANQALALADQCLQESFGLRDELETSERARLAAIEAALRESGSLKLAERVRARLDEMTQGGR